ncbi:MAG: RHS repeat-associated core domain-containing protein [Sporichthyaceae bacterium]|nr:RHS repeat-associated core domain-containing protein [Sporichthyaceae bacterium]
MTQAGQVTSFVYDANGARMIRREPGATTAYLGDIELQLAHGLQTPTGTRYYAFNGRTIGVRTGAASATVSFLATDHQGTATISIAGTTAALTQRRFTPFGAARGTPTGSWQGQRGFVGGVDDPSTGLVHLGDREYDPAGGRFMSVDPVVDHQATQQMHGYAYANSSPATLSDPDGRDPCPYGGGGCYYDGTDAPERFRDPNIPKCTAGSGFKTCERSAEADYEAKKRALALKLGAGQAGIGPARNECRRTSCDNLKKALKDGTLSTTAIEATLACSHIDAGLTARQQCQADRGDERYWRLAKTDSGGGIIRPEAAEWWEKYGDDVLVGAKIAGFLACTVVTLGTCLVIGGTIATVSIADRVWRYERGEQTFEDKLCLVSASMMDVIYVFAPVGRLAGGGRSLANGIPWRDVQAAHLQGWALAADLIVNFTACA